MFDNIDFEVYENKNGLIQKIHPYNLGIIIFLLSLCMIMESSIQGQILFLLFFFLVLKINKEKITSYFKVLFYMKWFLIGILFIHVIFHMDWIVTGISLLKIINVLILSQFMMKNIKRQDLTDTLTILLSPTRIVGINPSQFSFSISLAIHFIPLIFIEANKIGKSLASRGVIYGKLSLVKRFQYIKLILIPLFVKTIQLSDELSDTMIAKLYQPTFYKGVEIDSWKMCDSVLLMISLYATLFIFIKEVII